MYGTIGRFKLAPGREDELMAEMADYDTLDLKGWVVNAFFRADAGEGEYWLATVWESKEAYRANAESPEQDARYQKLRALLTKDPEWHDGEVIARQVKAG